ncbi:hypothetical protein HDV00_002356 [Rhizophlyctis rosea]|nr:hypothetical protein HDV00_002356 [Rhizophlyctis rosea]
MNLHQFMQKGEAGRQTLSLESISVVPRVYRDSEVKVIATIPSYVAFDTNGTAIIGHAAKGLSLTDPENTIFGMRNLLGRNFTDSAVQAAVTRFPFQVVEQEGMPYVGIKVMGGQKTFSPVEIAAFTLGKLKEAAEQYLGEEVKRAVISTPDRSKNQRALEEAGDKAGLRIWSMGNEHIYAGIGVGLDKVFGSVYLYLDVGDLDVHVGIVEASYGVFETLARRSDWEAGGYDFYDRVVDALVKGHAKLPEVEPLYKDGIHQLRQAVENAPLHLLSHPWVQLPVNNRWDPPHLTSALFKNATKDLLSKIEHLVDGAIKEANLTKTDITHIILRGPITRTPSLRHLLNTYFDGTLPTLLAMGPLPDHAVVHGTALHAKDLQTPPRDVIICDPAPLHLGIASKTGHMIRFAKRNSCYRPEVSKPFTTYRTNQTSVLVEIYAGERPLVKDNFLIGKFVLDGITPARAGEARIEVRMEFDYQPEEVWVVDLGSGRNASYQFGSEWMPVSWEEVEKAVREAEERWEEDEVIWDEFWAEEGREGFVHKLGEPDLDAPQAVGHDEL